MKTVMFALLLCSASAASQPNPGNTFITEEVFADEMLETIRRVYAEYEVACWNDSTRYYALELWRIEDSTRWTFTAGRTIRWAEDTTRIAWTEQFAWYHQEPTFRGFMDFIRRRK